ncbi:MAG: hypothetical protein CVV44_11315 [Spirochaetae bacterium HGW-Spirochaetae-1]|jgi:transcriptional regulator with XRE-family HTH domain|nr:MAG: hypothetical protein CVV44_11315 [Spirochaetae bacterium HGW-Spirochaetae-1]
MENLGQKLKDLRKRAGLSQKDLAVELGITPPNLSQWESMALPPLEGIIKVCGRLDIPLWRFFIDGTTELKSSLPSWVSDDHIHFLRELGSLPEDLQKQLLENFIGIISVRKML